MRNNFLLLSALLCFGFLASNVNAQRPLPVGVQSNHSHDHSHDHSDMAVPAHRTCGTDDFYHQQLQNDPELQRIAEQDKQNYLQWINNGGPSNRKTAMVTTIPVVVHVIYSSNPNLLPDARIFTQLDILNNDYARLNADTTNTPAQFANVAASTDIQFCLATRDPQGNPTTGINRIQNSLANHNINQGGQLKSIVQWDPFKYLNMYVVESISNGTILGYATLPWNLASQPGNDGVVIAAPFFGQNSPGAPYNQGRTTTHEVGHWLGLDHTFSGGCAGNTAATCNSAGDLVCDTPPTSQPNYNCPSANQNSCTETPTDLNDMHQNYMDYVDDACMNLFTQGQADRMDFYLQGARIGITTSDGCGQGSPPGQCGIDTVNYPIPGSLTVYTVPAAGGGGYVSGQNGYGDIAKAEYYPNTSNANSIEGMFLELDALSAASASSSFNAYIWDDNGGEPGNILHTENINIQNAINLSGQVGITFTNPVAVSGPFYVGVGIDYGTPGDTVVLLSNTINDQAVCTAWEQWNTNDWYRYDDASSWEITVGHAAHPVIQELVVSVAPNAPTIPQGGSVQLVTTSSKPGITYSWSPAAGLSCTTCANPQASPTSTTTYTLTASDQSANCFTSFDVTVTVGTVGIEDDLFDGNITAYPNPSSGNFLLEFTMNEISNLDIDVFNNLGQQVYNERLEGFAGQYRNGIDLDNVPAGVYFLRITDGAKSYRQKLIFE